MIKVKCKHCCKNLFYNDDVILLTSHNKNMNDIDNSGCGPNFVEHFLYMTMENVPMWIQKIIDQNSWTKGKLNCPFCNVRIGSFNLMVETKCNCGTYVVSPIKLIQSKLDIMKTNENNHYAYSQASIAR